MREFQLYFLDEAVWSEENCGLEIRDFRVEFEEIYIDL